MAIGTDPTKKAKQVLAPLLGAALVTYFAYHAVQGDRGLLAWWQLRQQMDAAEIELASIKAERDYLENMISLLRPENLDLDMLDEQTRRVLAFAQPGEYLIIPTDHTP
jgi:cell division protein FtsB